MPFDRVDQAVIVGLTIAVISFVCDMLRRIHLTLLAILRKLNGD